MNKTYIRISQVFLKLKYPNNTFMWRCVQSKGAQNTEPVSSRERKEEN